MERKGTDLEEVGHPGAAGLPVAPQAASHLFEELHSNRTEVCVNGLLGLGHQRMPDVRHRLRDPRVGIVLVPARRAEAPVIACFGRGGGVPLRALSPQQTADQVRLR